VTVGDGCPDRGAVASSWPGTLLDGTVVGGGGDGLWTLQSATVRERCTLALGRVETELPQAVWDVWANRDAGKRRVASFQPELSCEIHVSAPPPDCEYRAVWRQMLDGGYSFEPWFDELVELDDPARHLTVVSPVDREVFVFFATPGDGPVSTVIDRRERLGLPAFPEA
jgi:hypothetical protein